MEYLKLSGILIIFCSFYGVILPAFIYRFKEGSLVSFSYFTTLNHTKLRFQIFTFLSGVFQITFYIYINYKFFKTLNFGIILLIISAFALILLSLFLVDKYKLLHYLFGYLFFFLTSIGSHFLGISILKIGLPNASIMISFPIIFISMILLFLILKNYKEKVFLLEIIHSLLSYI